MRQPSIDVVDGLDDIGTALPADAQHHRLTLVMKAAAVAVLNRVGDPGDITEAHHRTVLMTNHQQPIGRRGAQRIAGLHLPAVLALLDHPERAQRIAVGDGAAYLVQGNTVMQQRAGIELHAHCRQRRAIHADLAHPGNLRQLLRQNGRSDVVQRAWRQVGRAQRQPHDRRLGRVDLAILRVAGHACRQVAAHRIDGRLHLPGGFIQVAPQLEGQRNLRRTLTAVGRDTGYPRDGTQRALQRRCHRGCHAFRAGPGQTGGDDDHRYIQLWQRRDRQQAPAQQAGQHQRHGSQRQPDRAMQQAGVHSSASAGCTAGLPDSRSKNRYTTGVVNSVSTWLTSRPPTITTPSG